MKLTKTIFFLLLFSSLFLIYAKAMDIKKGKLIVKTANEIMIKDKLLKDEKIKDCSHTVYKIYCAAGFKYEFAPTASFPDSSYFIKVVDKPQLGDVVLFDGRHMGIYSGNDEIIHWSIKINNNPEQIKLDSIMAVKKYMEEMYKEKMPISYYRYAKEK